MRGVDIAGASIDAPWLLDGRNSSRVTVRDVYRCCVRLLSVRLRRGGGAVGPGRVLVAPGGVVPRLL
jgi:hypothetical protein